MVKTREFSQVGSLTHMSLATMAFICCNYILL